MRTILITNDTGIASDAQAVGVDFIMVDLESMGKKERQASRTTFISSHQLSDVARIRAVLDRSKLIVRINPWHADSSPELEAALDAGADIIMLPMILAMEQVEQCLAQLRGRAQLLPLVETSYSMAHISDIAANPAIPEIYIGLNDLHLSLGLDFLFEPLALGILDWMASQITRQGKHFGFGGLATMGSGELPAQRILAEHVRLGSDCVILSSRFATDINMMQADGRRERLESALESMRHKHAELTLRSPAEALADAAQTATLIRSIAEQLRAKRR